MTVSGKVVHYDANRGFGFLAPESGGADVFLHINDIDIDENALKPGAKVEFDVEETDRGSKAVNVAVTEAAPADEAPAGRPHRRDGHDHGRSHGGDRPRRPRGSGSLDASAFTEEITELLLDSSDDLTAGQIVAIRQRITDFAVARGWVLD
ncbi:cold shock domain-containing protein [Gordonia sp. HNM0687]|uniref:Cold shock domain-containing protein n=1 Tax=Gordonia mangrovi TaxID=2665643 RepID=A0A6L7GM57_9ACTN|nr:cold shock domain-containing protein [Gordonia mangrovi]MDY6808025.1 cold shock domain-containing protein [Actinomycetota bacterium]MXP21004.1 cold shock domain-containing protein [Gordonia mangrovi]UVF78450.1 cold shock domain-containing protein [Gordonia mangrovi]